MRILVVEDDLRVASFIRRGLSEEQYTVDVAGDGEQAIELAIANNYDVMLLDQMLPKKNGIEVIRVLRAQGVHLPILMLTAKDTVQDKIAGLNSGADDYLTKPFRFDELLARIRALSRRHGELTPLTVRVADLELDAVRHRASRAGRPLTLTNREYALLEFLMRHAGEIVSRTMLTENVWEQDFDSMTNVIDVHIARLRRKIDDEFDVKLLHTIRGRGFLLGTPPAA